MFYYAITINPNHEWYNISVDDDISLINYSLKERIHDLIKTQHSIYDDIKSIRYLELVTHKNDTSSYHIHGLIICDNEITKLLVNKKCHIEAVLNLGKYQKYMINHDKVHQEIFGEMPYIDTDDQKTQVYQEMLSYYFSSKSALKTVQRFGLIALKYYRQLKEMEMEL